jgi:uncharacterized delta-60 repeat protein
VLQDNDRILFGGTFRSDTRNYVARLNAEGSLDTTFCNGPIGPNNQLYSVAVQPDKKILVGGLFTSVSGVGPDNIARLNSDGSLDISFTANVAWILSSGRRPACASSMLLQDDGKILIGGAFTSVNGVGRSCIARLNADGSLDDSFLQGLAGANDQVLCMALQSDGKIIVGGYFSSINGVDRNGLTRLNADGSLDNSFFTQLAGPLTGLVCLALQSDGKIYIGGYFTNVNGVARNRVARLNADGSLDNGFLNGLAGADDFVGGLAVQRDGKLFIGGRFTSVNGVAATNAARLWPDGTLDSSFRCASLPASGVLVFTYFALERDGKVLMLRTRYGLPTPSSNLFSLNADGSLDDTFFDNKPGPNGGVNCLELQTDGKILIGGRFTTVNQTPCSYVARLTGDYSPLAILIPPPTQTAETGSAAVFSARVAGFPPPTYQWVFNGNPITDSTNSVLLLSGIQASNIGTYMLVVSNVAGAITSAPAMLNVIAAVERRPVPGVRVMGQTASLLNVDYANSLSPTPSWTALGSVSLTSTSQFYFDLTAPLPPQRFYRVWQTGTPGVVPSLNLNFVPAITLTGKVGDTLRLDYINQFGPTDAWATLDTVTLTNTSQLYFDVSALGSPTQLYRIVPVP